MSKRNHYIYDIYIQNECAINIAFHEFDKNHFICQKSSNFDKKVPFLLKNPDIILISISQLHIY